MNKLKRIMKITATTLLAGVLTVSTVFAAPSPSTSGVMSTASSATDKDGNAVEVSLSTVDAAVVTEAQDKDLIKSLLGDAYTEGMEAVDVKEVTVPEGTVFPVDITFDVTGVTADTKGAFLHKGADGWEKIDAKFADGKATGTFTSLSPVALVVDKSTTSTSTTTSPKTGEFGIAMVAVAAVLAGGVLVFVNRKRKMA